MISSQFLRILIVILYPIFGYENWSIRNVYTILLSATKYLLFIDSQWYTTTETEVSVWNVLIVIFGCIMYIAYELLLAMTACILGITAITIWEATRNFTNSVQSGSFGNHKMKTSDVFGCLDQYTIVRLHDKFNELVKLANTINEAWSFLIFWYLFYSAVFFSTSLDRGMKYKAYFLKIYIIYNMGHIVTSVILSAESSRKVPHRKIQVMLHYA